MYLTDFPFTQFIVVGGITLLVGVLLLNTPLELFYWGGTRCGTYTGATGCVGYTPAGAMITIVVTTLLMHPLAERLGED